MSIIILMKGTMHCPDDWMCSICLGEKDWRVLVLHQCKKHVFHKACFKAAMEYNPKCPMCDLKLAIQEGRIPIEHVRKRLLPSL